MRIFTRHILIELSKIFLVTISALTMLLLIVGVLKEGMNEHLPMIELVRLIPYILPDSLRITVPVTLLLATTTVYARLSGFNEVVALKALGVSPWSILWPTYAVAFLMSLATVCLNDLAVSWGRLGVQRVITTAVENIAYNMLSTQRFYGTSRFAIYVRKVEGRRLIKVRLSIQVPGQEPAMITAEEAELQTDPVQNALRVTLREGTISYEGRMKHVFHDVYEYLIPLREHPEDAEALLPSWLQLSLIPGQIERHKEMLHNYRQQLAARNTLQLLAADYDELVPSNWEQRFSHLSWIYCHLQRLETEPYRRWATGFSCLFFVWVGAPLAIWLRNSDLLTSFFLCFLPILVVYYPLMIYGVEGAKHGTVPPWSIWSGDVLLAVCGAILLRRVMRY